jgi:uncharacterized phage infection (PIP) family protein YhgE
MAAIALALPLRDEPEVKSLLDLLSDPRYQPQRQEFTSLLDHVDELASRYNSIITKLDAMNEKLSAITDRKNPFAVMVERLANVVSGIGEKLKALKDSIVDFAKNTLEAARDRSLSAAGAVAGTLHIHEGLESISKGLGKAAAAMESIEQFHQERVFAKKAAAAESQPSTEQAVGLSEILADMRLDFENLPPEELKATYEKLLSIGMDNDLTANELNCLQYLTEEAETLMPDHGKADHAQELEIEAEQGEEI